MILPRRFARLRQWALTLFFALCAGLLPLAISQTADASLYICRGDPIITMSDGTSVTLAVDLTIPASQVASVVYTIHAPTSARLNQITYLPDDLAGKESVVMLFDSRDNQYHVTVVVMSLPVGPAGLARLGNPAGQNSVLVSGYNSGKLVTKTGQIGPPIPIVLSSHK
jgi:hypothetical protein